MAAMEDDVFFDALQKHCKITESALLSKCNMNHQLREVAREKHHQYYSQLGDKSTNDFPVICYTDSSKIDDRVDFTLVVFRSGVESENFQFNS
ncbi:hypothetical protein TNCV_3825661 [Trichonephila clavipes]|nr:hypothetical protein TNCV_3825661 [Trichonephila clavipes]